MIPSGHEWPPLRFWCRMGWVCTYTGICQLCSSTMVHSIDLRCVFVFWYSSLDNGLILCCCFQIYSCAQRKHFLIASFVELLLCDSRCLMAAVCLSFEVFSCNQSGFDLIGFLIWAIEMMVNFTYGHSGKRSRQHDKATEKKYLNRLARLASFMQFVLALSRTKNTFIPHSIFAAHLFYIFGFLLCHSQ